MKQNEITKSIKDTTNVLNSSIMFLDFKVKLIEDHYEHFSNRLKERYGLSIEFSEFESLSQYAVMIFRRGFYRFGYVYIGTTKVYIVWHRDRKTPLTALPGDLESDPMQLFKSFFHKSERPLAEQIFAEYKKEDELIFSRDYLDKNDFIEAWKDKAVFFQTHITKYIGTEYNYVILFMGIRKIIQGKHKSISLRLESK